MKFTLTKSSDTPHIQSGGVPKVNLLPREVTVKRAQTALFKAWGVRALASVAVLGVAALGVLGWQTVVALQLAAEEAEGQSLLTQIAQKNEIQQLVRTEGSLRSFSKDALATDLVWSEPIALVLEHFPEGSWLCAFDLQSGASPSGDPMSQVGLSGVISICGDFPSAIPYLQDIRETDQLLISEAQKGRFDNDLKVYVHELSLVLNQTVYLSQQESQKPQEQQEQQEPQEQQEQQEAAE